MLGAFVLVECRGCHQMFRTCPELVGDESAQVRCAKSQGWTRVKKNWCCPPCTAMHRFVPMVVPQPEAICLRRHPPAARAAWAAEHSECGCKAVINGSNVLFVPAESLDSDDIIIVAVQCGEPCVSVAKTCSVTQPAHTTMPQETAPTLMQGDDDNSSAAQPAKRETHLSTTTSWMRCKASRLAKRF